MKPTFKPFAASGTGSSNREFRRAVLRLTAFYAAGILLLTVAFSASIYLLFDWSVRSVPDPWTRIDPIGSMHSEDSESVADEIREHLADILMFADTVVIVLGLGLSYLLARKTIGPLEDAARRQAQFVADAAHELRTPLAVLRAGSEVTLRKERSAEAYRAFIGDVQGEVARLSTLAEDLLFLANDRGPSRSAFGSVSLSRVCETQREMMRGYAESKRVSVSGEIEPDLRVMGREGDLTRLVINLLKNAVDYNVPGGTVSLSLRRSGDMIVLACADTGIGIAADDLPRVFDRFYKADHNRVARKGDGAGLGLAIVRAIVRDHGGTVGVRSEPGAGTTFEVSLPAA